MFKDIELNTGGVTGFFGCAALLVSEPIMLIWTCDSQQAADLHRIERLQGYYMKHERLPEWLWPDNLKPVTVISDSHWYDQNGVEHLTPVPNIKHDIIVVPDAGDDGTVGGEEYYSHLKTLVDDIDDGAPYAGDIQTKFDDAINDIKPALSEDATAEYWLYRIVAACTLLFLLALCSQFPYQEWFDQPRSTGRVDDPDGGKKAN